MVFILGNESDIQRFALDWCYSDDDILGNYVNRWIVHAVKRNVQEMTLDIWQYYRSTFEIPHQLLNCKSLIKLEMQVNTGAEYADVILPKSMDLLKLKVLHLHGFSISNEELYKRLFSSCPVLKTLEIYSCDMPNLIVNSLSLENFVYKQFRSTMANIIKLTAPNLKDFECRSFINSCDIPKCSLLSNVQFDIIATMCLSFIKKFFMFITKKLKLHYRHRIQSSSIYIDQSQTLLSRVHKACDNCQL
ncbi:putative F-box/FBD/LRR-repeat protein At5g22670 [Papaver somniferum]|uniref:putative F-box/FBD/LRR-repeat protein At5g22670 n=1 Tax=Papaver somniferum TaxID=3469 RepID=UPI000E6F679C|nr:putative F-box/FBD/LRR-repeat protein At5g22670 [Papaver somniferum]